MNISLRNTKQYLLKGDTMNNKEQIYSQIEKYRKYIEELNNERNELIFSYKDKQQSLFPKDEYNKLTISLKNANIVLNQLVQKYYNIHDD